MDSHAPVKLKQMVKCPVPVKNSELRKDSHLKAIQRIKVLKKQHYSELLNNCQDNIKKSWQIIKGIVNRNKSNQLQTKFKLNNGGFTTDGYVISNKFNDFFINIGPNLAANIPKQNLSPLDFMDQPLLNSIYLSEVTSEEISNILKSLKKMVQQDMII